MKRQIMVGVAGQRLVEAELLRRDWIVGPTPGNTPGVDLLGYDPETGRHLRIQVKTARGTAREWLCGEKDETPRSDIFVFANIPEDENEPPTFSLATSEEVGRYLHEEHQDWLKGKPGRLDNPMRKFRDPEKATAGRWKLLEKGALSCEALENAS